MKKVLKIFIIIVAIIGFIFGITTIVKFIKLKNIYKKIDTYVSYQSFYMKITQEINEEKTQTEVYYRNGTGKQIASNGIYTWTDGDRGYLVDEENSTIYTLSLENNAYLVSYNMFASSIQGYNLDFIDRFLLAGDVNTTIKKETIDNIECYCITSKINKAIKKVWIEQNSSKIKKAIIEFSNGDKITYDFELSFNTVKASDVALPDITGYKMINGETGTVLAEKFNEFTTTEKNETENQVSSQNTVVENTLQENN